MCTNAAWRSVLLSVCLLASNSFAGERQALSIVNPGAQPGAVALGAAIRGGTNPYRGVKHVSSLLNGNKHDLIPLYLYEGEWLFARGSSAGIHLLNNDRWAVDALVDYRFDRLEPDANDYFTGMSERRQTVDGGLSVALKNGWGAVSAAWVSDLMGRHNGYEWNLSYRYRWRSGRLTLSPFVSYIYQDRDLVNYYYGVRADEARADRPVYQPGSTDFLRSGINVSYQWTPRVLVFSHLAVEQVSEEVHRSPLVDERQLGAAWLGFSYQFGSVLGDATTPGRSRREGERSWRVNAGYAAEGPFHRTHRGDLTRSQDAHTYIGGLTVGRLLSEGKHLDYWGRLSVNRRFENGYQSDIFEYNAYVMAMTTRHSPKTREELFRYGLGFGFSYADQIPAVEQVKQARRQRNSGRFLNYLEAQFDVPLQLLFGDSAPRQCYTGLSLLHRSGIFANSDLLGNVSGGSDMVTGHIECRR
ncbi:MipA/OmpV family protein [Marinobacter sp. X15-166B]|uniref:MipA/OmpV family protein n=1 Tax=Marinobacter sp. X15-166B TaxID=1897620 RepID=UPI00085CB628|nr:MipA/OmpV family protein [Marinobacter sp. X15-166B]OEY65167.1 hypothetical protein BG841_00925 [Marinobacter sp. X15-166B]